MREMEGVIDYIFLSDIVPSKSLNCSTNKRVEDYPIRLTHLVSKYKDPAQLDLPFVKESIEKAINKRNIQLEKTKVEIIAKNTKAPKKRKEKIVSKEEVEFAKMVQALGGLDNVLKMMEEKK